MSNITIRVDDLIAKALAKSSQQEKAHLEEAFNLWWKVYLANDAKQKLGLVTEYFREKSVERGLTDQEISALLANE